MGILRVIGAFLMMAVACVVVVPLCVILVPCLVLGFVGECIDNSVRDVTGRTVGQWYRNEKGTQ